MHQHVEQALCIVVKGNKCAQLFTNKSSRKLCVVGCFLADACIVCVHMQVECGYHYFTRAY